MIFEGKKPMKPGQTPADTAQPAIKPAPPAPTEDTPKTETVLICPNCRWNHAMGSPSDPTEEDKVAWVRSVKGGKRFRKTYALFEGEVTITFRTRSVIDNEQAVRQTIMEIANKTLSNGVDNTSANIRIRQLHLASSLVALNDIYAELEEVSKSEKYKSADREPVAVAFDVVLGDLQEPLISVVQRQFAIFESLCLRLLEAGNSSNFFAARTS